MQIDSFAAIARKRAVVIRELAAALEDVLKVNEELMPGIRHISVSDYSLLNEAPIRARKALNKAKVI